MRIAWPRSGDVELLAQPVVNLHEPVTHPLGPLGAGLRLDPVQDNHRITRVVLAWWSPNPGACEFLVS